MTERTDEALDATLILAALDVAVCVVDFQGVTTWSNAKFQTLDEGARTRIASECRAFLDKRASCAGRRVLGPEDQPPASWGPIEISSNDQTVWYELTATVDPGVARTGPGSRAVAVARDITAARRVRMQRETLARAGEELVRLDREAIRKMNAHERLKLLESKIIGYNRDLLHFDHFVIRLLNEKTGKLEIVFSVGLPSEIEDLDIFPEPENNGISGWVAATGQSYICRDVGSDEKFLPGLSGAKSSLTVPLRLHDRVLGIMDVESCTPAAFSEEDRQSAEIFARHIAIALHMLDLLVAERSTTNEAVSRRVDSEVAEPLQDILREAEWLDKIVSTDPEVRNHIDRIKTDCDAIRRRMQDVTSGPQTLLGVEEALAHRAPDPLLVERWILIADDEPKIRRVIGDVLRNRGAKVVVVDNGGAAIEYLEACHRGEYPPFELVISDIKMPDRNGYEVFSAARRCLGAVPVILMTGFGYDPHHSIVRASQEGQRAVLFKPFQIEKLLEEVRGALPPRSGAGGA
ncbi:MAG: response regulator [Phycisphaeraceae bacterium]|nr:response regulator [Phycisphaeraceae bacterium]